MSAPLTISVEVGQRELDYQGGNLLNAINEVVCYYQQACTINNEHIAELLQIYAKGLVES